MRSRLVEPHLLRWANCAVGYACVVIRRSRPREVIEPSIEGALRGVTLHSEDPSERVCEVLRVVFCARGGRLASQREHFSV